MSFNKDIKMDLMSALKTYHNNISNGDIEFNNKNFGKAKTFYCRAMEISVDHFSGIEYSIEAKKKIDACEEKLKEKNASNEKFSGREK